MFFGYIILAGIIFIINSIPGFMPPTWTILAFAYLHYHLSFVSTVIIGATFATLGRIVLYTISRKYFHRFFSKKSKKNYESVGKYLNARNHITIPLILAYSFLPIPSNQVYIAAGLAKLHIRVMATAFFIGRIISYSFWVGTAKIAEGSLQRIFSNYYSRIGGIVIDIIGFGILYFFSLIKWEKLLKQKNKR